MAAVSEVVVEGVVFPPVVCPPGSGRPHFLAGAGVRGLDIDGNFIKFTATGVYLEEGVAVPALAKKWAGKSADELASDVAFFRDIFTGDFGKFTRVTLIRPLTGEEFSNKVSENCVKYLKATGAYTDAEVAAVEKFKAVYKPRMLPPGASNLFTHSPAGVLTVSTRNSSVLFLCEIDRTRLCKYIYVYVPVRWQVTFSEDSSVPESGGVAIDNKPLCEALLESIIGKNGVSPAAKLSIAARMSELLKGAEANPAGGAAQAEPVQVSA
ncbi:unnamed protein product [Urochloa decumbens]|uniref:Chalcone-flavonone isomerase family protein n=1 Tax=Urochloa decumbens TaxID=240449 RepID=A0ABC8X885_9POAL